MYGFATTPTGITFGHALQRTRQVLTAEGFGILSDIEVQVAMKDKPGVDMPCCRILGACNPQLAHQVQLAEQRLRRVCPSLGGTTSPT